MAKFDYKKWVTENKYGKLNEQAEPNPLCYGCEKIPNVNNLTITDPYTLINGEPYTFTPSHIATGELITIAYNDLDYPTQNLENPGGYCGNEQPFGNFLLQTSPYIDSLTAQCQASASMVNGLTLTGSNTGGPTPTGSQTYGTQTCYYCYQGTVVQATGSSNPEAGEAMYIFDSDCNVVGENVMGDSTFGSYIGAQLYATDSTTVGGTINPNQLIGTTPASWQWTTNPDACGETTSPTGSNSEGEPTGSVEEFGPCYGCVNNQITPYSGFTNSNNAGVCGSVNGITYYDDENHPQLENCGAEGSFGTAGNYTVFDYPSGFDVTQWTAGFIDMVINHPNPCNFLQGRIDNFSGQLQGNIGPLQQNQLMQKLAVCQELFVLAGCGSLQEQSKKYKLDPKASAIIRRMAPKLKGLAKRTKTIKKEGNQISKLKNIIRETILELQEAELGATGGGGKSYCVPENDSIYIEDCGSCEGKDSEGNPNKCNDGCICMSGKTNYPTKGIRGRRLRKETKGCTNCNK